MRGVCTKVKDSNETRQDLDTALLDRCLEHDRDAWSSFVERFSRLIYSVVYETLRRHGVPPEEERVDEYFAATFLKLYDGNYRKLRQWSGRCSLASWIRLITVSLVVDDLRKKREALTLDDNDLPPPDGLIDHSDDPHRCVERQEELATLELALGRLAPADAELLRMLYREGLSPQQVVERLGVNPGTVYTRKNRALTRLRAAYIDLATPVVDSRPATRTQTPEPSPSIVRMGGAKRPLGSRTSRRAGGGHDRRNKP